MKKLLAMLMACSLILSMAACNSGGTASSNSQSQESTQTGVDEGKEGEVTKIMIGGVTGNAANDLLEAHQEELKEEIGVEVDFSVTTFEEYQQKLLTLASANSTELDLCFVEAATTATLANGGVLEPLDPFFEKKNFKKFINHFCKIVRCIPERANK